MACGSIGKKKEWEKHIRRFSQVYSRLFPLDTILDIGANFGYHTLLFSKIATTIYAFEPQTQNFHLLQENIKMNEITNVIAINDACGDESVQVHLPIFDGTRMENMGDITPNLVHTATYSQARSIRLDDYPFTSKIGLIKIDVQGWEKKVLLGATNLLDRDRPVLIVEFESFQLSKTQTSCRELFDFIRKLNYSIFYLEYEYPSDYVCIHQDHVNDFREKFGPYLFTYDEDNSINHSLQHGVDEKISMTWVN
jgi:FkbM family methyltransferase